jgi:nicotinamidase-related amidase
VHPTINVATGRGQPTLPELADLLKDDKPVDRTTVKSWEDVEFVQAVHATGRRKLIFCALWTEICLTFAALDALREGYEVYPVVDAIGGTSPEAHRAGLDRVILAGGQPISSVPPIPASSRSTPSRPLTGWTLDGYLMLARLSGSHTRGPQ